MIRFFDITISAIGIIFLSPLMVVLCLLGFIFMGNPIFVQKRLGLKKVPFTIYKFRSMLKGTHSKPTHQVDASEVPFYGRILRNAKLDELPQLLNVLKGEMSLVGPRPCLENQLLLIKKRDQLGIFNNKPGITGVAQLNKIDMSRPVELAQFDSAMLKEMSLKLYFKILILTIFGFGSGDNLR